MLKYWQVYIVIALLIKTVATGLEINWYTALISFLNMFSFYILTVGVIYALIFIFKGIFESLTTKE